MDFEVKKVKEIEMQLDYLMIDKKSFQMDDLIFSIASCHDVKLSHNELFLLMKYFFNINNHEYGVLKNLNHDKSKFQNRINFPIKIQIYDTLQKKLSFTLPKEFSGTFDLNLAREREEIDFFALGHPLINSILDYCRSREFKGFFTILNLKSKILPPSLTMMPRRMKI